MQKGLYISVVVSGAMAIMLGAFGAHALANIKPSLLSAFKTANYYHFFHLTPLFFLLLAPIKDIARIKSVIFFQLGVLLFSGSLYLMGILAYFNMSLSVLGPLTPIGGIVLILAWLHILSYANVFGSKKSNH